MKFRSIFFSSIVAGLILSASAFAQDDKQKPQTPSTQTQPADQTQAPAADPGHAAPADQCPALARQVGDSYIAVVHKSANWQASQDPPPNV